MPSQQLYASNISVNVGEALEARIKDPLWFLARQWQTGEFEAENGGSLAAAFITSREYPLNKVTRGDSSQPVSLDAPLDALVEAEAASGDSPAWNSESLAYSFGVETAAHKLKATDYFGKGLDWFHFDVAAVSAPASPPATTERRIVPTALQFRGMPHPRWWRFEDGDADFERPDDPEPNILATLLPEFVVIDSNNWYLVPLKQTAGTVREIVTLQVVDGFGVVTEIGPSERSTWRMFSMSGESATANNGALLFVPNIALDVLDNDQLEEIVVLRDEDANLVWAVEREYPGPDGEAVLNGDRADGLAEPQRAGRMCAPAFAFARTCLVTGFRMCRAESMLLAVTRICAAGARMKPRHLRTRSITRELSASPGACARKKSRDRGCACAGSNASRAAAMAPAFRGQRAAAKPRHDFRSPDLASISSKSGSRRAPSKRQRWRQPPCFVTH